MSNLTVSLPVLLTAKYVRRETWWSADESDYVALLFGETEVARLKPQCPSGVYEIENRDEDDPTYWEEDWAEVVEYTVANVLRDILVGALTVR